MRETNSREECPVCAVSNGIGIAMPAAFGSHRSLWCGADDDAYRFGTGFPSGDGVGKRPPAVRPERFFTGGMKAVGCACQREKVQEKGPRNAASLPLVLSSLAPSPRRKNTKNPRVSLTRGHPESLRCLLTDGDAELRRIRVLWFARSFRSERFVRHTVSTHIPCLYLA